MDSDAKTIHFQINLSIRCGSPNKAPTISHLPSRILRLRPDLRGLTGRAAFQVSRCGVHLHQVSKSGEAGRRKAAPLPEILFLGRVVFHASPKLLHGGVGKLGPGKTKTENPPSSRRSVSVHIATTRRLPPLQAAAFSLSEAKSAPQTHCPEARPHTAARDMHITPMSGMHEQSSPLDALHLHRTAPSPT